MTIEDRIKKVICEHYAEQAVEEILNLNVFPVIQRVDGEDGNDVYFVQLAVAYLSDDDYTIHTETVRVDVTRFTLTFTLINETDTQMKDEL